MFIVYIFVYYCGKVLLTKTVSEFRATIPDGSLRVKKIDWNKNNYPIYEYFKDSNYNQLIL